MRPFSSSAGGARRWRAARPPSVGRISRQTLPLERPNRSRDRCRRVSATLGAPCGVDRGRGGFGIGGSCIDSSAGIFVLRIAAAGRDANIRTRAVRVEYRLARRVQAGSGCRSAGAKTITAENSD